MSQSKSALGAKVGDLVKRQEANKRYRAKPETKVKVRIYQDRYLEKIKQDPEELKRYKTTMNNYNNSQAGKAARDKYMQTEKGKAAYERIKLATALKREQARAIKKSKKLTNTYDTTQPTAN